MAKSVFTNAQETRIAEIVANALAETLPNALATALAHMPKNGKGNGKTQPTVEKVAYTKADGTTVMATPKQVAAWDAWKEGSGDRKERADKFEQMKATWEESRKAYKPSKALKDAIKSNRASVTLAVAKTHGFVGTKQDLAKLKDSLCK